MPRKTFEEWMKEVDTILMRTCYLSSADLPDCCYRDWYDQGVTPRSAASRAKKNASE